MKHKRTATAGQNDAPSMPLSSLLLGKSSNTTGLDADLDSIFKSSVRPRNLFKLTLNFRLSWII